MTDPTKGAKLKSRLGRGLSSLISVTDPTAEPRISPSVQAPADTDPPAPQERSSFIEPGVQVVELPLDSIVPNPHQPRRQFNEGSLQELAGSLKSSGMIQPIIVRTVTPGSDRYQLIAGERRWRAAKLAKLVTVPAIVRDVDGAGQAQMALIENIQREDLNPLDRAMAYRALLKHLGLTQAELASRLGEDRTTVTHFLRLLELPEAVQQRVGDGKLSMGHAKLLGGLTEPSEQQRLADLVLAQSLTIRNLERLIEAGPAKAEPTPAAKPSGPPGSAHLQDLERSLARQLSMRVQVRASSRQKGRGKLILHYASLDQFDDLMSRLGVKAD